VRGADFGAVDEIEEHVGSLGRPLPGALDPRVETIGWIAGRFLFDTAAQPQIAETGRGAGGRKVGVVYLGPVEFGTFMAKSDADLGATMKAVGIVK